MRATLLLPLMFIAASCGDPLSSEFELPELEFVAVDEGASNTGVTTVGWSHPDGAAALAAGTATATFMVRDAQGTVHSRTLNPVSRDVRPNGTVELRFNDGLGVPFIRVAQADTEGRWLTADCIAPLWRCETVRQLSYPAVPAT